MKFGIDPTRDRLHLGHFVPLRVVRKLQEAGHDVHLVLGTFTAQMGDPSGQDKTRPILSPDEVKANADQLLEQVRRVLLPGFTVHRNHEWFDAMTVPTLLAKIASRFTVANLLARDGFKQRAAAGQPIGLHELIVPLLQAWDSVVLRADVEIGGTDQLFNFAITRDLQAAEGQRPEWCLLTPIIDGTDGRKMSKSFGNCVFLDDAPGEVFGRIMSISDEVMDRWVPLLTDAVIEGHPMARKKSLAWDVLRQIQGMEAANVGQHHFETTVQRRSLTGEEPLVPCGDVLSVVQAARGVSRSEARRLLKAGAVNVNGRRVHDPAAIIDAGSTVRVGKRVVVRTTTH